MWRTMSGGFIIAAIAGAILGLISAIVGLDKSLVERVSYILGVLVWIVWGTFVVGMCLRKEFNGFRIVLVPTTKNPA